MNDVLALLLVNTAIAAAIAGLAACLLRVTGHAPIARALFVLALVKLVLPPLLHLDVLPGDLGAPAATDAVRATDPGSGTILTGSVFDAMAGPRDRATSSPIPAPIESPTSSTLPWTDVLFLAWLCGGLVTLGVVLRRVARCRRLLARATPAPTGVRALAVDVAASLGLRRVPEVRVVAADLSPFVFGFARRPLVVVPERLLAALSEPELRAVLAHELSHIANRDHLTRWLELVVLVVHWWNPLLFWIRRRLHAAEEIRCDARAVRVTATGARRYGRAILKTTFALDALPAAVPLCANALGDARTLKRRLIMITKERLHHRLSWPGRIALALGTAALLPIGLRAQEQEKPRREKAEAQKAESSELRQEIREMVREAVREALRAARDERVEIVDETEGVKVDADEIRAKIHEALENAEALDPQEIHEKVQKALKAHGIEGGVAWPIAVDVDSDEIRAKIQKALQEAHALDSDEIHAKIQKALQKAHALDSDEIHAKIQKALEKAHAFDPDEIHAKIQKALEKAHQFDADEIHAKVQKALEKAHAFDADEIRAKVQKALEKADGWDAKQIQERVQKALSARGIDGRIVWPRAVDPDADRDDDDTVEALQREIDALEKQIRALERRLGRNN